MRRAVATMAAAVTLASSIVLGSSRLPGPLALGAPPAPAGAAMHGRRTATPVPPSPKPVVGVLGDSITFLIQSSLAGALAPEYHFQISGKIGWTIAQQYPALRSMLRRPRQRPHDVIVNLGTNDVLQGNARWRPAYDRQIRALQSTSCVILVTVNRGIDQLEGNDIADQIDTAITRTVARHRNFHELDWDGLVAARPDAGLLMRDGIHPAPAGQQALVWLYLVALQHDCNH